MQPLEVDQAVEADRAAVEADQSPDQSDRIKPWTIKGIPPEVRNAAIAAAEREGQTIGEWFTRAIPAFIQQARQQQRLPVRVEPDVRPSDPQVDVQADIAALERLVGVVQQLHAVTQEPPPKSVQDQMFTLVRQQLRGISGRGQTRRRRASDPIVKQSDPEAVIILPAASETRTENAPIAAD
jgi:hypothetical protein